MRHAAIAVVIGALVALAIAPHATYSSQSASRPRISFWETP